MISHLLPLTYITNLLAGIPIIYLCGVSANMPLKMDGERLCPECLKKAAL